jgi:hypothetical protein
MPKVLPDIIYEKTGNSPVIDAQTSMYQIPFNKNEEYFSSLESYNNFVKAVEKLVRTNDRYKRYIKHLKKIVGLNKCQVLSKITDDDAPIEMHHGPILNLYDYCVIMIDFYLSKGWKVTTFRIADAILYEHEQNRIQIVMLSETVHQEVHEREIFINYKQGYGDLRAFIDKYGAVINDDIKERINRYIDKSIMYDSNDYGIFRLSETLILKSR